MKTTMTKQLNEIHKEVIETRISVGKIEEHLKSLNGTVKRHEDCIDNNEKSIHQLQKFNYKLAGGIAVAIILFDIGVKYFLKI